MKKIFPLFIFATLFFPFLCFSYQIENIPVEPQGDFILAPGKIELWLNPGEKVTKEIVVTNRLGKKMKFAVEIEDFVGSFELEKPIILLGHEKGPYSLKDYIKPEIKEFTLEHGQRITIPIEIAIPENAEPGGKYGAVIVSTVPEIAKEKEKEKVETGVVVVARLANLFFVRVKGEVKEEGMLKEFNIAKKLYFDQNPEFKFKLIFENKGNVHLAPYGIIEVFNFWGKKISEIEVAPWFVLPNSLKLKEINWKENRILVGKYKAVATIDRGYKGILDKKEVEFWVLPLKTFGIWFGCALLIILLGKWFLSHYEIRKKV